MTQGNAAVMTITEAPRLPLSSLRGLRREIDHCLTLLGHDSRRAEAISMQQRRPATRSEPSAG
ncbi:hypothetical protein ACWTU6_31405 [Mesorhizobium sp. BHbsci]